MGDDASREAPYNVGWTLYINRLASVDASGRLSRTTPCGPRAW